MNGGGPSHHTPDGGFRNPWIDGSAPARAAGLLRWWLWERVRNPPPPDPDPSVFRRAIPAFASPRAAPGSLTLTWVGHSTFLLQIGGKNLLFDPVWSDRASPVAWAGPRRQVPPAVPFEHLPPVDAVLLSHDHYDHLDDRTIRALIGRTPQARWFAPLGLGTFFRTRGASDVVELDWWGSAEWDELGIGATPAQHFSSRSPFDRNRSLWCGWTIAAGKRRVFYAGDTGYHPEFGRIAERYGPFDLTLLPIGAYEPRWFMAPVHMNPEDAVRAYQDVAGPGRRAGLMVPMHWGTFKLTDEPLDEPPRRMAAAWQAAGLPAEDLRCLAHGETIVL